MNVDSILLSEYASTSSDGKLTVVNAFNQLRGPGPRWSTPILYLSMVVHAHADVLGKSYPVEVKLVDAQRNELLKDTPLKFDMAFTKERYQKGSPVRHVVTVQLLGVVFEAPGAYAFEVYIDGVFSAAHTLYINKKSG